jgi:hypothetical protein
LTGCAQSRKHIAQIANPTNSHDHRDDKEGGPGHNKIEDPEVVPGFHNSIRLCDAGAFAIEACPNQNDITFRISLGNRVLILLPGKNQLCNNPIDAGKEG